jgi:hypothetical protein
MEISMKNTRKLFYSLTLSAFLSVACAQNYTEDFAKLIGTEPSVEINLGAMMLGLLSSATENEEQGISNILSSLDSIRVTVFNIENSKNIKSLKDEINNLAKLKTTAGFEKLAVIKEDDSLVYVLAKMDKKNFTNLSVFALDDEDELVLIDIQGTILLSQLGDLMDHFNVDLDINGLKIEKPKGKDQ